MTWDGKQRSSNYDNLHWVNDSEAMSILIGCCDLKSWHTVCDLGTGTGIVAYNIAPYCHEVIAIDPSIEMLNIAQGTRARDNIIYRIGSVADIGIKLHRIVARMALHHVDDLDVCMINCYKHLDVGGKLIVCEGIPQEGCEEWYKSMFSVKEKRETFTASKLFELFERNNFDVPEVVLYTTKNMSINNWLNSSGLDENKKKHIFNMHVDAPKYVKEAYKMKYGNGDIVMDWKTIVVVGQK